MYSRFSLWRTECAASAKEAVRQLQTLGVQPVMITGDAEAVAATVARELGLERFHARVLPQDKAEHRAETQAGRGTRRSSATASTTRLRC